MYTGFIANRYANALYDFAEGLGQEEVAYLQAKKLINVFSKKKNLLIAFQSPLTSTQIKIEAVEEMISEPLCESLEKFIKLVTDHNRERFFFFMLNSYEKVYKERQNIVDVTITTAAPIDSKHLEKVVSLVGNEYPDKKMEVIQKVNPAIIGGFIIRINNKLINASLGRQISLLKQKYEQ